MSPQRIQRKRTRGWRLPAGAACVTRPGRFGNPYEVARYGLPLSWALFVNTARGIWDPSVVAGLDDAEVREVYTKHREWLRRLGGHPLEVIPTELGGKDLACWCALPEPGLPDLCHASIELAIANPHREERDAPCSGCGGSGQEPDCGDGDDKLRLHLGCRSTGMLGEPVCCGKHAPESDRSGVMRCSGCGGRDG